MNFETTVDRFLQNQKIGERSMIRYRHKLNIFNDYLTIKCKVGEDTLETYLRGIRADHILNSLDFYIQTKDIKCEDTARSYISTIREYFRYINREENLKNNLVESFSYNQDSQGSFSQIVETKIKELRVKKILKYPRQKPHIEDTQFNILYKDCDEIMNRTKIEDIFKAGATYNGNYTNFIAALITKLILFTGIKFKCISTIKESDLNLSYNTITINDHTIHLPQNLSDQLRKYKEFRDKIESDSTALLIEFNGEPVTDNNDVANLIKRNIDTHSTISIGKFAIINMIKKGINQSIIQRFTGYGIDVYTYCQEVVNEEKTEDKNRYLDSKIRNIYTFDIL